MTRIELQPGAVLWPSRLNETTQRALVGESMARIAHASLYHAAMPRTGKRMSVAMTNFGPLGWVSDQSGGYRYQTTHPETGAPWPSIPDILLDLWRDLAEYAALPEACLVNLYRGAARLGLHRDMDEAARDAPVLSVSLGDDALFRFGGDSRKGPTRSLILHSGDVLVFGGPARMMVHGVDRIREGTSRLVPGGGRLNLTLRRVTKPGSGVGKTRDPKAERPTSGGRSAVP